LKIANSVGRVLERRYHVLLSALLDYARTHCPDLLTPESLAALDILDAEVDVIANIMDELSNTNDIDLLDKLQSLYVRLSIYLTMRNYHLDKLRWGEAIMQQMVANHRPIGLAFFNNHATAMDELGDYERAIALYTMILAAIPADTPTPTRMARVHSNLGVSYWKTGKLDEAMRHMEMAVDIEREQGNLREAAMSLMNISSVLYEQWEMAKALEYAKEAVAISKAIGEPHLIARLTPALAVRMVASLQFDDALPVYEEALQSLHEIGDEVELARTQFNYALLCRVFKQYDKAQQLASDALMILEAHKLPEAQNVKKNLLKWSKEDHEADEEVPPAP
jgi:tetratricopeptide (TPR) repeat protein